MTILRAASLPLPFLIVNFYWLCRWPSWVVAVELAALPGSGHRYMDTLPPSAMPQSPMGGARFHCRHPHRFRFSGIGASINCAARTGSIVSGIDSRI